ncbi:protein arginine methyltransferase NDUFAF7, mitochondrial isoform X1 [Rhinatrema bivittatum]|uniref:protein arginine methyltransferase NDUFAF7, mitochondrial isoform X1 n=1 Tax=Rhinatrema bivittatum TaxID=194408 RepID=UPI0011266C4F|nr:protein arginine methyltransferase NDUFAF7, mitochondrial isoform X1 [Rhinatrema bivittatum]
MARCLGKALGRAVFAARQITLRWQCFSSRDKNEESSQVTSMLKHLIFKIKSTGPITVAEYMREVLTNPVKGYYLHHDMLGEKGDFITSPEISQIFGELLGIWVISEWMAAGKPKAFQLVELGPGRGTLMDDVLRVFHQFRSMMGKCDISVHLVEISPKLSELQALKLTGEKIPLESDEKSSVYKKGTTMTGLPIFWYHHLQDIPQGTGFYLAHEFFDALPIHKFQKTEHGWMEVLVDIDPQVPDKLRFVLAPTTTLASKTFIQSRETREHVEVSPTAGIIIQELACRIENSGGAALITDYGHDGQKTDTLRAFCGHKLHDVLTAPGTADLTADVDFSFLRRMAEGKVASLGPITQQEFLKNMGIDTRLKVLVENSKDSATCQQLLSGYDMLTNPEKMGSRFKFFAMLPQIRLLTMDQQIVSKKSKSLQLPVAGFSKLVFQ